jgi:hypothetical protein
VKPAGAEGPIADLPGAAPARRPAAQRLRPLIAGHAFDASRADRVDLPNDQDEEFYVSSQPLGPVLLLTLRYYRD